MSFTGVIPHANNGEQGRTTIGPKLVDRVSASKHGDNIAVYELELQLDGDVATEAASDFLDETRYAAPAGSLVLEAFAFSDTGVAALNVGFEDADGNGSDTNLIAGGTVPGQNWLAVRNVDFALGQDSQVIFSGMAPGERATVLIRVMEARYLASDDGVLAKHLPIV